MTAFGEAYLVHPNLFPARRAGEAWGDRVVTVDFAGGPYRFRGLSAAQASEIRERFADLLADDDGAAIEVLVFKVDDRELKDVELAGWSYTFDRDYQAEAVRLAGWRFLGRVDWRPELCGALWTPEDGADTFRSQLENFFRFLVAYRLLDLGGLLLHSAGVAAPAPGHGPMVGHLFFGHSGAGKSTLSRLALDDGRQVLSDDLNAISPGDDGRPWIERLPFAGDLGHIRSPRQRYPLASLSRLRQGDNRIEALRPARAIAQLVACAPFVNVDPHRVDRLTSNLERLALDLGVHELTFSKAGGFWPLVDALAAGKNDGRR